MSEHNDEETPQYEMIMPFVTGVSVGGPHDDVSYGAGWAMATLDAGFKVSEMLGYPAFDQAIEAENLPQADLIAMRHGYRMDSKVVEDWPEWSDCHFERQPVFDVEDL